MNYSPDDQRAFYRRQTRRLLNLVDQCDDPDALRVLLEAAMYYMEQAEGRPIVRFKKSPSRLLH